MQFWVTNVHSSDADKTIDGEQPRAELEPKPIAPPQATVYDYGALITVERHHYLVSRELAKGGMGRVLEARDLRLGRQVAIKELLPRSRDAAKRFEREALITARLQHPSIIHVYEAGIWPGGEPFYAMPHVAGRSLDKVVAERTTLAERLGLLSNVVSVADALAYAHSENVIHRDLKPANVLVGEYGETVVIDWGLAKDLGRPGDPNESLQMRARASVGETLSGSVVGTPAYMPPEQARGEAVDERSDVYAIGALLYKVLAGHAPYEGATSAEVLELVKTRDPVRIADREPELPRDLSAIVEKAMARDPAARYATAGALARDLKRFQLGQLVDAHRYTRAQLVWRFVMQHRVAFVIAATAFVALGIVGVVSVRSILREKRYAQSEQAKAEARRTTLLDERGRSELLAGHAGAALSYFVAASHDDLRGGARGFLIADALRPFKAAAGTLEGGTAVAVSPDDLHIVTAEAHDDETSVVRLFGIDGTLQHRLEVSTRVRVVAFDPSSTRILAASDDGIVRIWSVDGSRISELRGNIGAINDAAFSPDGTRVVTGGEDATVRVWNATTGAPFTPSFCHVQAVKSVRFSPDSTRVASGSQDHNACVSDASSGAQITLLRGHKDQVNSVRWTADGSFVLTASDDGTANVWSARGANPTPDTAGGGKPVIVPLHHDRGASIDVAELSPDGRYVLTAGDDHLARVWELPELVADHGTPAARLVWTLSGHAGKVVAAAFSSDGLRIATAGYDNRATVWDATNGQEVATFEHADIVGGVAFAHGHDVLVTGSGDRSVRIWNIPDGVAKLGAVELDSPVHAIAAFEDGTVAIGTEDSNVTLWHGGVTSPLVLPMGHIGRVLAVAASSKHGVLVTGGDDDQPIVWNVDRGIGVRRRTLARSSEADGVPRKTRSISVSPEDGDSVATVLDKNVKGLVRLWSAATGRLKQTLVAGVQIDMVTYSSRGLLAGAGIHGALVVWDRDRIWPPAMSPQPGPVTSLAFSDDGSALVVAGQGAIRIYGVAARPFGPPDLRLNKTIAGPTGEVRAVVMNREGTLVITASDDGIAKVWDANKGKLLAVRDPHGGPLTSLALTTSQAARDRSDRQWTFVEPTEDTLWIASEDGTVGQWNVSVDATSREAIEGLMKKNVPWELGEDDVTQRVEGSRHGKH